MPYSNADVTYLKISDKENLLNNSSQATRFAKLPAMDINLSLCANIYRNERHNQLRKWHK